MYFTGISLNMMSLSGLALGIGMLVDNSIVVIENIYRLRSMSRRGESSGTGYETGGRCDYCFHPDNSLRIPADGIYRRNCP